MQFKVAAKERRGRQAQERRAAVEKEKRAEEEQTAIDKGPRKSVMLRLGKRKAEEPLQQPWDTATPQGGIAAVKKAAVRSALDTALSVDDDDEEAWQKARCMRFSTGGPSFVLMSRSWHASRPLNRDQLAPVSRGSQIVWQRCAPTLCKPALLHGALLHRPCIGPRALLMPDGSEHVNDPRTSVSQALEEARARALRGGGENESNKQPEREGSNAGKETVPKEERAEEGRSQRRTEEQEEEQQASMGVQVGGGAAEHGASRGA